MKVCPQCGREHFTATYVGYIGRDENRIQCENCGWVGKGYQLIEDNETKTKTIKEIINKHIDWDFERVDFNGIAREICREIEKLFLNDKKYKRCHEIDPMSWRQFRKANGLTEHAI